MSKNELDRVPDQSTYLDTGSSSDGVDVAHVAAALRDNRRTVFTIGAIVFVGVAIATCFARMEFQSTGRLYLGELDDKSSQKIEDFLGSKQGDVYNEIEILRSNSHVKRAILQTGLNVSIKPEGWAPPRYLGWILSGREPSLLDIADRSIAARDTALTGSPRKPKSFTIEFGSDDRYTVFSKAGEELGRGALGTPGRLRDVELTLFPGTAGAPRAGARYEMTVDPLEETVEDVLRKLDVNAPKGTIGSDPVKVLLLEFEAASPRKAAAFLERLMLVYLEERQAWKTEDARAAEAFVTQQLSGIQKSLNKTDKQLAEFRAQNQPVVQASQAAAVVAQLGTYEQQSIAARLQVTALRTLQQKLSARNPQPEAFLAGDEQDPMLQRLAESLALSQQRLAELDTKFSDKAPEVVQLRAQMQTQLSSIRSYVGNRLARAQQQVAALDTVIRQYEDKLRAVPGAEVGLSQIGRDNDVYSRIYSFLLERQQQTAIVKASTVSKNRILDVPQIPRREYTPKLWLRFANALLGFLLGVIVVIVRSLSSKALRTEADVRSLLTSTAVFAHVPRQGRAALGTPRVPAPHAFDLLAGSTENSGFFEAFRTLRTNLYFALSHDHGKVVLVTSPSPGDGKTTTTLCLAALLAADGKCVLTIDADLRKPSHHLITGHWPDPGLRGILQGNSEAAAVHCVSLTSGVFDSISAGLGGSAELLSSRRLSDLLIRARHQYDYILLDSPSFPLVSDALILARQADFVMSVMRMGNTSRRLAEEHMRGLVSKARGHAIVVNGSDAVEVYGHADFGRPLSSRVLAASTVDQRRRD